MLQPELAQSALGRATAPGRFQKYRIWNPAIRLIYRGPLSVNGAAKNIRGRQADSGLPHPIVSSSSIIPAITDNPRSQNFGSFASRPNGLSSSEYAWYRRPRASRDTLGKPWPHSRRPHRASSPGSRRRRRRRRRTASEEVGDVDPVDLVARLDLIADQALALHHEPDLADPLAVSSPSALVWTARSNGWKAIWRTTVLIMSSTLPASSARRCLAFGLGQQPPEGQHLAEHAAVSASVSGVGAISAPFCAAST